MNVFRGSGTVLNIVASYFLYTLIKQCPATLILVPTFLIFRVVWRYAEYVFAYSQRSKSFRVTFYDVIIFLKFVNYPTRFCKQSGVSFDA